MIPAEHGQERWIECPACDGEGCDVCAGCGRMVPAADNRALVEALRELYVRPLDAAAHAKARAALQTVSDVQEGKP